MATKSEANISSCKVDILYSLGARVNTKPKTIHNFEPIQDTSTAWAQLEEIVNDLTKNQTLMMNKISNLERVQKQAPKPPFRGQPQNPSQAWRARPSNEQRVPNTLDPSNFISQEETPCCLNCKDSDWENECLRNNRELNQMNPFDAINHIFMVSPQVCLNITPEQLEERKRETNRRIGWKL
jgi:hypothetical protein